MRGRRLASFRMTMTKQELEDALARKQRTDTERLDWLETNKLLAGFHQFGGEPNRRLNTWIIWDCSGNQCRKLGSGPILRDALNAAMDAEERG